MACNVCCSLDNVRDWIIGWQGCGYWCGIFVARKNQVKPLVGLGIYLFKKHRRQNLTGCHRPRNIFRVTIVPNELDFGAEFMNFPGSWSAGLLPFVYSTGQAVSFRFGSVSGRSPRVFALTVIFRNSKIGIPTITEWIASVTWRKHK